MQRVSNVAVIATRRSPDSVSIAQYYAEKRKLPNTHILMIDCVPQEEAPLVEYRDTIEKPVMDLLRQRGLELSVDYLVLTRGIPLRIREGGFSVDCALMCAPLKRPFNSQPDGVEPEPLLRQERAVQPTQVRVLLGDALGRLHDAADSRPD
jgi:uncharacterized protein (TIGR03790 family)